MGIPGGNPNNALRDFLSHYLTKYHRDKVYLFSTIELHILCLVQLNIFLNVDFMAKNPKKYKNDRPYLNLQLLPNCSHQKSFTLHFLIFSIKILNIASYLAIFGS